MSARILVFAREPAAGMTKTRLIPVLGPAGAAHLHAAFARDTVERAVAAAAGPVEVWGADGDATGFLGRLAAEHGLPLHRQRGGDLGERMLAALATATADGSPAMVIGSDCPALGPAYIARAAAQLAHADAVLGPAVDGGYVLLGVHRVEPSLFGGIAWGGDRVLMDTRSRLAALGWSWRELAPLADIDRPEDLDTLAATDPAWRDRLAALGCDRSRAAAGRSGPAQRDA